MKSLKAALVAGAMALSCAAGAARADVVNFDEFTSPPVTCCYNDTGVTGTLTYAHVTISAPGDGGFVMNSGGWAGMQTSGDNLYGSKGGSIDFDFNTDISSLVFDLINGTGPTDFQVQIFDASSTQIGSHTFSLGAFPGSGGVFHVALGESGVRSVVISGNEDFAVDTLGFTPGNAVPEPATWALMLGGFGLAGAALRRRRAALAA